MLIIEGIKMFGIIPVIKRVFNMNNEDNINEASEETQDQSTEETQEQSTENETVMCTSCGQPVSYGAYCGGCGQKATLKQG